MLPRKAKTLNEILGGFRQMISDLELLQSRNGVEIEANAERILKLSERNHALDTEKVLAAKVQAKIQELVS